MAFNTWNQTLILKTVEESQKRIAQAELRSDNFLLLICGIITILIQPGLALLEAGFVRSKNTTNILTKNFVDFCFTALVYWAVGYSFSFGRPSNAFIGHGWFFGAYMPLEEVPFWFTHFCIAAIASTVVAGAVAERCTFHGFLISAVVITGFIYPVVVHWCWDPNGWLSNVIHFEDIGGSGVIYLTSGTCALMGATVIGPRLGRFRGWKEHRIGGHSITLVYIGGFLLLIGQLGFIAGVVVYRKYQAELPWAMVNAIISASSAGITALVVSRVHRRRWSAIEVLNGVRAGMVAICGSVSVVEPWAAFVVGIVAHISYYGWSSAMRKIKIDDPLDAWAVHGGAGIAGIMLAPLFKHHGVFQTWSKEAFDQLAYNLIGTLAIFVWSAVTSGILFLVLSRLRQLRVSEEVELKGLDIPEHGETAYPTSAYGQGWAEHRGMPHPCSFDGTQRSQLFDVEPESVLSQSLPPVATKTYGTIDVISNH